MEVTQATLTKLFEQGTIRGFWHKDGLYIFRDTYPRTPVTLLYDVAGPRKRQCQYFADGEWHDCEEGVSFDNAKPWLTPEAVDR